MQRADALMQRVPLNTSAAHFVLMQRAAALMRNGEYTGSNRGLIWEAPGREGLREAMVVFGAL